MQCVWENIRVNKLKFYFKPLICFANPKVGNECPKQNFPNLFD